MKIVSGVQGQQTLGDNCVFGSGTEKLHENTVFGSGSSPLNTSSGPGARSALGERREQGCGSPRSKSDERSEPIYFKVFKTSYSQG